MRCDRASGNSSRRAGTRHPLRRFGPRRRTSGTPPDPAAAAEVPVLVPGGFVAFSFAAAPPSAQPQSGSPSATAAT
eukprot:3675038-Alexandrium_andersonii.AAC.1